VAAFSLVATLGLLTMAALSLVIALGLLTVVALSIVVALSLGRFTMVALSIVVTFSSVVALSSKTSTSRNKFLGEVDTHDAFHLRSSRK